MVEQENVTKEFLSKKYDELCEKADKILKKNNPCAWKNCTCKAIREHNKKDACCTSCEHLKSTGCSVKSLSCKTWLCIDLDSIKDQNIKAQLHEIEKEARKYYLWYPRFSKEQAIKKSVQQHKLWSFI